MWKWLFGKVGVEGKKVSVKNSTQEEGFELDKYRKMCSEPVLSFVDAYYSDRNRFYINTTYSEGVCTLICLDTSEGIYFKVNYLHPCGKYPISERHRNDRITLPSYKEVKHLADGENIISLGDFSEDLTFLTTPERQYLFRVICVELEREGKYESIREQRSKRKENLLKENQRQKLTSIYKKETL